MRVRAVCRGLIATALVWCCLVVPTSKGFAAQAIIRGEVWASGSLLYGQPLSSLGLDGVFFDTMTDQAVAGTLEWKDPQAMLTAGTRTAAYRFVPLDTERYATYTSSLEFVVSRRTLDVYVTGAATKEYDGLPSAAPESVLCSGVLSGDEVDAAGTVYYYDADAGLSKLVERVEVELLGADSGNYTARIVSQPQVGNILPYENPACAGAVIRLPEGAARGLDSELPALLTLEGPGTSGAVHFQGPTEIAGDTDIFREPPILQGERLHIELAEDVPAGKAAVLRFTVSSANYRAVEAEVRVEIFADRQVGGVTAPDWVYNGQAYQPVGEPTVNGLPAAAPVYRYSGRGSTQYGEAEPPVDAGDYTLTVSAPGEDATALELEFTIFRAPLTVTPVDCEIVAGQALPAAYAFRYDTLMGDDTPNVLSPLPEAAADVADSTTPGSVPVRLINRPEAKNYVVTAGEGQLVIRARQGEGQLYTAPAPGAGGWYNAPVTVIPALPERYSEIALSPQGPFAPSVTIRREGTGSVPLYFRGADGEVGDVQFPCRLDSTAPAITGVTLSPETGVVTVSASDALSGVDAVKLFGPDSDTEVDGQSGVFRIGASGRYTVVASDVAGNTATGAYQLTVAGDGTSVDWSGSGAAGSGAGQSASSRSSGSGSGGLPDGESSEDFWNTVIARIRAAQPGGTVRLMSAVQQRIPAAVLRALRESGATLRIIRPDGDVLIPGSRLPTLSSTASYTLEEVLALLLPVDDEAVERAEDLPVAPEEHLSADANPAPPQSAVEVEPLTQVEEDLPPEESAAPDVVQAFVPEYSTTIPPIPTAGKSSAGTWTLASVLGMATLTLAGYALKLHL